jgi:hypothetical protein
MRYSSSNGIPFVKYLIPRYHVIHGSVAPDRVSVCHRFLFALHVSVFHPKAFRPWPLRTLKLVLVDPQAFDF